VWGRRVRGASRFSCEELCGGRLEHPRFLGEFGGGIQALDDPLEFLPGDGGGKDDDAVVDLAGDDGCGEPFLGEGDVFVFSDAVTGEEGDMFAAMGTGVGIDDEASVIIELKAERVAAARGIDDIGLVQVFFGEEGTFADGEFGAGDFSDDDGIGVIGVPRGDGMEPEFGVEGPVLASVLGALATGDECGEEEGAGQEIAVERDRLDPHSAGYTNRLSDGSKDPMSKPYNKHEKRRRREAYIKRKRQERSAQSAKSKS